ncbi:fluoride efflux transporter CrcB [Flaviflexus huanghaiensis]|uniref:fluoride efflux transporter CrcB n=1 Tax=Flaviflexus huanghaiensis TaxID=1111473 RepID=UPI0015F9F936
MNPVLFVWVSLAGGLGASARFVLDGLIRAHSDGPTPRATIIINVTGSFLLGLLIGITAGSLLSASALLIMGTGFLGGYTTFSTASVETVRLIQKREVGPALFSSLGTAILGTGLAALGLWLGSPS